MDNLHHLCIGFDNWTQVGFDSEDPKFSFGARQLEKGAREDVEHPAVNFYSCPSQKAQNSHLHCVMAPSVSIPCYCCSHYSITKPDH